MCISPRRHEFLKALPKCEHHIHIEGALTPRLMLELANRNDITLPRDDSSYESEGALLARYDRFTSLDDFLRYYYTGMSVLRRAADFDDLAWSYFETAAEAGVVHAEISFDPQAHLARGVTFTTVVAGLTAARERAEQRLGMSTNLICCFLRHLPPLSAARLLQDSEFQASFSKGLITGVGLDSSENDFPPELFEEVYRSAKSLGLRLTAHAGEEGPASNIESALRLLCVERIDHGIRLADSPELMSKVAKQGALLTVCPFSNVRLRCVPDVASMPIRKFLDAGIKFSINSDDPAYFGGFLLENYCAVQDSFDLDHVDWERICSNAIRGSWCTDERKAELLLSLNDVVKSAA